MHFFFCHTFIYRFQYSVIYFVSLLFFYICYLILPYSFTLFYPLFFFFRKTLHSPLLHSQFFDSYLLSSVSLFTLFLFVTLSFSSTPFFLCETHRVQRYMRFSSPCPPSYSSLLTVVRLSRD